MCSPKTILRTSFLLGAIFFSLQIIPRWQGDSIVIDEEWNLTSSYCYWKTGDVWTPCGTAAPGALCAVPLLFMDLRNPDSTGQNFMKPLRFLFLENGGRLEAITAWSRGVNWLLGLLTGFLVYRLVQGASLAEGVAAMILWSFEPTLLGYFGTARTNAAVTFWFLLCIFFYSRAQSSSRLTPFAIVGFLAGLTAASRYNGLFVLPVLAVLEFLYFRLTKVSVQSLKRFLLRGGFLLAGATAAIGLCYLPGTFRFPGHPSPLWFYVHYLADYYSPLKGVSTAPIFFAGKFWPGGSYLNFPFHFLLKNTVPFLVFVILGTFLGAFGKIRFQTWIWAPPAVYLSLFYGLDKSMTLPHALPAYPFLILIAAKAFGWTWRKTRGCASGLVKASPALLLAWHPLSVLCHFPRQLAYANDFITPRQEANLLFSFNWNLGQDMKRLAELGREKGWKKVKLLTYQRTDPFFYGLPWESWTLRDLEHPSPGTVYVLDPDIFRDDPDYSRLLSKSPWVNHLPATGDVGGTLYYWEIPGNKSGIPDNSPKIDSFPYYPGGIPPYSVQLESTGKQR